MYSFLYKEDDEIWILYFLKNLSFRLLFTHILRLFEIRSNDLNNPRWWLLIKLNLVKGKKGKNFGEGGFTFVCKRKRQRKKEDLPDASRYRFVGELEKKFLRLEENAFRQ